MIAGRRREIPSRAAGGWGILIVKVRGFDRHLMIHLML
jgi:hypothetical protein